MAGTCLEPASDGSDMISHPSITVRPQSPGDRHAVAALIAAAFGQTDEARLVERLELVLNSA